MLFQTAVLLSVLVLAAGSSCSNRLYRGQRLNVSQYLCARYQDYRLLFASSGQVQINEPFPRETSFKPPPQTLFSTNTTSPSPSHVTFTDSGDFVAVGMDGTVYWQANVTGADFLELQDTGIAVLFAKNASTVRVLWKSLSMYSLRIVGGTNPAVGRLEFYFNNAWGTMIIPSTANSTAHVACRTLGFDTGIVLSSNTEFGSATGPVWMEKVMCRGKESVLQECPFGTYTDHPPKNWWGAVSQNHGYDMAISCQGSSLGVLPPTAHVCSDRLYVGQTLSLGECLCAGPNGEYTLRFSNKRWDTVVELWYKLERKWMIGMANTMPANAAVRLDGDGVMRIVYNDTGLPYSLFTNTIVNASFVELQDNGVVRVVSLNGSTGWRKSPNDSCFTEKRKISLKSDNKFAGGSGSDGTARRGPLQSIAACTAASCKTIAFLDIWGWSDYFNAYPWDPSTTNSTYFEKIPGCASGPSCYQNYSYDIWTANADGQPYIDFSLSVTSEANCTSWCDSTATCVSAYFKPNSTCYLGWKRINETVDNMAFTSYIKKTPCPSIDPSEVPLLPVKACPTTLLPGSLLLSQQFLCSPNGQHVFTVEKDGRLLIDGGKWISNNATDLPGYLQYTTTNQLLFRLDDGSTPWAVAGPSSSINPPAGYLALSNGGILQMFDSTGHVIGDHQNGVRIPAIPIDNVSSADILQLVDSNTATCVSRVRTVKFRLSNATLNAAWDVVMTGHGLQCGDGSQEGAHSFALSYDKIMDSAMHFKVDACSLLTATSQECRFHCLCSRNLCEILVLIYKGCGDSQGDICEVALA